MRIHVAEDAVSAGRSVRIACDARGNAAVSIWGDAGSGPFPLVPFAPGMVDGKPQFVKPLFKRFDDRHVFEVTCQEDIVLIVMLEVDTAADIKNTGLEVRFIHGKSGAALYAVRRVVRDALRACRGAYDSLFRFG